MMLAVVVFCTLTLTGSAQQPLPEFEVASVRPSTNESGPPTFNAPTHGTTTITNGALRDIIAAAFGIPFYLAKFKFDDGGRHNEVLDSRFDIIAKPPDNMPPGQAILMLRRLLSERFNLRVHTETRQVSVYRITLAQAGKLGPNMRPSAFECDPLPAYPVLKPDPDARPFCPETLDNKETNTTKKTSKGPIAHLITTIQGRMNRPVIDSTELTGSYEWELRFQSNERIPSPAPSIFNAFREQLGLNLKPETGPVEVLVIDSVEMPTPN
jgi:uncharacterized protein (TIGR03435 family)